jgi:hypothetical protein
MPIGNKAGTQTLRNQLAQVLRRLRALSRSGLPLTQTLDSLAALKQHGGGCFDYIRVNVVRPEHNAAQYVLKFALDRERLRAAAGVNTAAHCPQLARVAGKGRGTAR